jgi:preprotein translocase subunit SecG
MVFVNGLLTFILVLDCLLLIFLVLIQLPKKEAGAGLAFGGAATDALFGAGSGNVLTKVTKYAATIFFVLVVLLAILQTHFLGKRSGSDFERRLREAAQTQTTGPSTAPAASAAVPVQSTNTGLISAPAEAPTAPAATNAAPAQ